MVIRGTKILNNNQNMSSYIQLFKSLSATLVQAYLPKCINTRNYQVDKQRSKVFRSTVAQMPQVERRVCFSSFPVHFQNRGGSSLLTKAGAAEHRRTRTRPIFGGFLRAQMWTSVDSLSKSKGHMTNPNAPRALAPWS